MLTGNSTRREVNHAIDTTETGFHFFSRFRDIRVANLERIQIEAGATSDQIIRVVRSMLGNNGGSHVRGPIVVGALPFSFDSQTALFTSRRVHDYVRRPEGQSGAGPRLAPERIESNPPEASFLNAVEQALRLLDARTVQKVVLARALEITLPTRVDPGSLVSALVDRNHDAYTFAVPLGDCSAERPHWFIGASPELLVRKRGLTVTSNPLAGSIRRGTSHSEDEANAQALLASKKDREEHEFVVAAVIGALKPFCRELNYPAGPSLIQTPTVWHLSTVISGELTDPAISSLDLAMALHPTPAVCGHPTIAARHEGFNRDLYAGFVGWCDAGGDGEWAVAIRCGEFKDRWMRLFAGAGIVAGSIPEAELAETTAKLRTMLNAINVEYR